MARQAREEGREETGRRKRIPLGVPQLKLSAPKRAGFHRHWLNDTGGRIQAAEQAGYSFVENEQASEEEGRARYLSRVVGVKEDGSPMTAYLMEIRQDWYDEDQAEKQNQITAKESEIRRGRDPASAQDGQDKFYGQATIEHR